MSITLQRLPKRAAADQRFQSSHLDNSDPSGKKSSGSFAGGFTHFEWRYLCSYRWFLKHLARAVETDDFSLLQTKAEKALVRARLRRSPRPVADDLSVCHSAEWYD